MLCFFSSCLTKEKALSFDEITDGLSKHAVSVREGNGTEVSVVSVLSMFKQSYKKYTGQTGNTAHRSWSFYDERGELLFELTDLGNNGLIMISVNNKNTVYKED